MLAVFSLVMSLIIIAFYQHQSDKFNQEEISGYLNHMVPRIQSQQQSLIDNASQIFTTMQWAGLLDLRKRVALENLQTFFTSQGENIIFDGVVISDEISGKLLFNFWHRSELPDLSEAMKDGESLWMDNQNNILYSKVEKISSSLGHSIRVTFFKAWDSAMMKLVAYPETTDFISLGDRPLLSSAGNLALQSWVPSSKYTQFDLNGTKYHESSIMLGDVLTDSGQNFPLKLTLRAKVENTLSVQQILFASVGVTLLFGALLFLVFGVWLRRLGARLDQLASAALHFQQEESDVISNDTLGMLEQVEAGENDQISFVAEELSDLMISSTQRHAEQRAYLQTLDLLQDAVIEFTLEGQFLRATSAWISLTGVKDLSNCGIFSCVHPEDGNELLEQISAMALKQKSRVNIRFRLLRPDDGNKYIWVEGRFAAVTHSGKVESIRGVVRDITNSYRQERQINHMALHDSLTDLPNRILLDDRLEMSISRAARTGQRVALGFIDLDHFKQVNDNFGHKLGDRLLREVTGKFLTALRSSDTLSRWGGDEFVVLCPDLNDLNDAKEITQKLSSLAQENISIDGMDFPFTFSAGFAVYPDDASNGEMLLAQADRAMFYAKAQGRNNIQFFNAIAGKEVGRQSFYIQSRLTQAIHGGQIQCWLQPILSADTDQVVGAEALARWYEPEQGWIPPSVFIPMAESMGLIDKLGQSVWQQALHALTLLPEHHRLSVNFSKRQLFTSTIVQQLHDDIVRANIVPHRVLLEITESIALSEVEYAKERISELDKLGFGISIDDFGVGYSSLSQLHEIPANELKLDISFVSRLHQKSGLSMATAIISIAKSLEMECVAEGVEDARTAHMLRKLGVERLQGYYFAEPMPIDDYLVWLKARNNQ